MKKILVILLVAMCGCIIGCKSSEISYSIIDEKILDAPIKTEVNMAILVSDQVTEQSLNKLLTKLYTSALAKRGFKFHTSPTNIYIYVFVSKEHYDSGMGQWIAMLEKSYDDKMPNILFNKNQLYPPKFMQEEKFGLSEMQRKNIWTEIIKSEDNAWAEAEKAYPSDLSSVRGMSREQIKAILDKQYDMKEKLKKQYRNAIAEKYKLTEEQLKEITLEGLTKNWAMPPS